MGIIARDSDGGGMDLEILKEGIHKAVCIGMVHIGHILNTTYQKVEDKIVIIWAFPDERVEFEKDGEKTEGPRWISRMLTKSLNSKATLRTILESWRGTTYTKEELDKGVDISKIIRVSCLLQILHNTVGEKVYANIANVLPDQGKSDYDEVEKVYFSWEDEYKGIPENIPKWIKSLIEDSSEYGDIVAGAMSDNAPDLDKELYPDGDQPF